MIKPFRPKRAPGFGVALLFCLSLSLAHGQDVPAESDAKSTSESKGTTENIGTGMFSTLPFHVSVSVRGGYDDNINTSRFNRQESAFTNLDGAVTYDFGSPRTQLSLQVGGGATYYWDNSNNNNNNPFNNNDDYDVNAYLSLTLKHKASARLTFDVTLYGTYQTEPDFTLAVGLNRRSGNYFYTQDRGMATYLWSPRFATATSYTFAALRYDDTQFGLFEDRIENTFGNEFKYLWSPTTSLVAEYRFGLVNYDHEGDVIGAAPVNRNNIVLGPPPTLDRDSQTHYVLAGIDHSFSPRFTASFRGGAEFREYVDADNGTDPNRTSPYFESTLSYILGRSTSVSWTTRYAIEEGDVLINPSRETFRTGLRLKHDLTSRITGNFATYYEHDNYDSINRLGVNNDSPSFNEDVLDIAVSLRYAVTRYFGVEVGYNHTEVWSDSIFREYSRNRYWGGLNVIF